MTFPRSFSAFMIALACCGAGCKSMFLPLVGILPEPTKDVPAEYPYLVEKRVVLCVWADSNTLFEFPNVQYELAEHVAAALAGSVEKVDVVPSRDVVDLQSSTPDWDRKPAAWIGQQFDADRVIMLELIEYTTREPGQAHLLRGRIAANVKVYDTAYVDAAAVYRAMVEVQYPKSDSAAFNENDGTVRRAAMELFASEVAGKFYDRKVKAQ